MSQTFSKLSHDPEPLGIKDLIQIEVPSHNLTNQPQIRSGVKEPAQDYCAFGSTILDVNAQDTKQQQTKT